LQNETERRFENKWHEAAESQPTARIRNYSRNTDVVTGGDRNTKPDGWADSFQHIVTPTRRTTIRHRRSHWFEVKAKDGKIYNSTSSGQIRGHIDNLSRTHPAAARGRAAALTLVTTLQLLTWTLSTEAALLHGQPA
jgi:hypothetical protein